jgi:hypothetical protein
MRFARILKEDFERPLFVLAAMGTTHIPRPPGNQSRRFPHRYPMGPPPLRGLCMVPITARATSAEVGE